MDKIALILIVLAVILVPLACAADQIGQGARERTVIIAHEEAADMQHGRQFREQANLQILAALPVVIWTFAGVLAMVGLGLGCVAIRATWGMSGALVERTRLWSHALALDEATRQYPLITRAVGGCLVICNPNTGQVWRIDGREAQPVPQLVTASGAVQLAGAVAREARQARDAAGVAAISPPLVIEQERAIAGGG